MEQFNYPTTDQLDAILKRPVFDNSELETTVSGVLNAVKTEGDSAIKEYTEKFDGVLINEIQVSRAEIEDAKNQVGETLKGAIEKAKRNIEKFHEAQRQATLKMETSPGVECWRKSVPITKVGLYIPGGTAPLFSTVLMLGVPANIAGCEEIILCTPPNKEGKVNPVILYAADYIGVTKIFKVGGVQAIGAMAFGTESIPQVYKIFGPGNQYVTTAKQLVSKDGVSIDMPAGPSEVLVAADRTANPAFIASDLLSQAEHGADSQVIFVTWEESLISAVLKEIENQLADLPRKEMAKKALSNSKSILVKGPEEAMQVINAYAPEHLIFAVEDEGYFIEKTKNAGSVFIGNYTPESAGDYASGTNHTLPTNGYATAYSGVSLDSYVKKITYQKITKEGIKQLGPVIEVMAEAEGLHAHKNAVTIRLNQLRDDV